MRKLFLLIILLLVGVSISVFAQNQAPFFLSGDGKIKIKNLHNGRLAEVQYLNADGSLNANAFAEIDRVFAYPTQVMGETISPRLIAYLDYFSDTVKKNPLILISSGYRSPRYNASLRAKGRTAAKTSTHMDGMALDFSISGMDAKKMWEFIRSKECCGAGYYHGQNVHLDAGRPRFWTTATAKTKTKESDYNRYIYYSTEYDRYQAGDKIRSFFTSISDFGFGVKNTVEIFKEEKTDKVYKTASVAIELPNAVSPINASCLKIDERKKARFLYLTLPEKMKPGRYQIKIQFCDKPFEQMPDEKISNVIEIKSRYNHHFEK